MRLLQSCGLLSAVMCAFLAGSIEQISEGKYYLKSHHNTYIGVTGCDGIGSNSVSVRSAPHATLCEQWSIERHGDKITMKTVHTLQKYLQSNYDRSVGLSKWRYGDAMWTPIKRNDGTWSFKSAYGGLLSSDRNNNSAYLVYDRIDEWENFALRKVND